jgi:hypothetical protein
MKKIENGLSYRFVSLVIHHHSQWGKYGICNGFQFYFTFFDFLF